MKLLYLNEHLSCLNYPDEFGRGIFLSAAGGE